jgi:hypothetical protein
LSKHFHQGGGKPVLIKMTLFGLYLICYQPYLSILESLWFFKESKIWNRVCDFIREAEKLGTSKWHCLDFIWSVINHIYPFLSHFDLVKTQKFEIEPGIWNGSRTQNQVQMTKY